MENPSLDAQSVQPRWLHRITPMLKLTGCHDPQDEESADDLRFSLWKIPGRKALFHDGHRTQLTARINHQILRLLLAPDVEEGGRFAFAVSAGGAIEVLPVISWFVALFAPRSRERLSGAPGRRPSRQAILHMRTLQALDGEAAGATHREIAEAIFGVRDVWERWSTDSELRAQVRYLLRRGHALVSGGYRDLLSSSSHRSEGENREPIDSP